MAPTLVASRTALPPEGAAAPAVWQNQSRGPCWFGAETPTLPTALTTLPPEGAASPAVWLSQSRDRCWRRKSSLLVNAGHGRFASRVRGFTLIELLVALAAMAVMAGLSWRGLDGMVRAQSQIQQRADAVLTLQAGLTQWSADLDGLMQLPRTKTLDWDGRGLRLVRRSTVQPGGGLVVVAWARRNVDGTDQWLRWQSPPQFSKSELQIAWAQAAQWAQNPGDAEKKDEVRITPLAQWQIYYFRGNAWTNPLSSDNSSTPALALAPALAPAPALQTPSGPLSGTTNPPEGRIRRAPPAENAELALPDGIRLVLTLPAGQAINGLITHDWVRPALARVPS